MKSFLAAAACFLVPFSFANAQQATTQQSSAQQPSAQQPSAQQKDPHANCPKDCPMRNSKSQANMHDMSMMQRGEMGMGFSQTATTHHFFLNSDGGVIQVEANDPSDTSDRDKIRMHLGHIAQAFADGDFDIPMFVHDTTPPGVPEMKRLRDKIKYSFVETPNGGRVVISTADPDALAAIHNFLRFQIQEHKTGDSAKVTP